MDDTIRAFVTFLALERHASHETVRNYFNIPASGRTQKLGADRLCDHRVREVFLALVGAHR